MSTLSIVFFSMGWVAWRGSGSGRERVRYGREEIGERGKKEVQKGEDVEKKMIYREEKVKLSRVESRGTEQTN